MFQALQAVQQLLNYVAYVRTGDSLGFLDIFQKLAHFFDHRSNKRKFLECSWKSKCKFSRSLGEKCKEAIWRELPVNITSKRNIFQDRIQKNFYYFKSRLPDPKSTFIRHLTEDDIDMNEQFIHFHDGMKIYCLPSKLKLLGQYPITGDGTWSPVRYIQDKQMYILVANVIEGKKFLPSRWCMLCVSISQFVSITKSSVS